MYIPTQELVTQCSHVPITNRLSKAYFSSLDRLEKKAPHKGRTAKSGAITFSVNNTSKYIQQLEKAKKPNILG